MQGQLIPIASACSLPHWLTRTSSTRPHDPREAARQTLTPRPTGGLPSRPLDSP